MEFLFLKRTINVDVLHQTCSNTQFLEVQSFLCSLIVSHSCSMDTALLIFFPGVMHEVSSNQVQSYLPKSGLMPNDCSC